jgi:hypothetical protein
LASLSDRYIGAVAADGDTVFIPVNYGGAPVIKRYVGGAISDVFALDLKGASSAEITDVAIAASTGWAVGSRRFENENGSLRRFEPFLIKYESHMWREITLQGVFPGGELTAVEPIGFNSCWLLFAKRKLENFEPTTLWKYDSGTAKEFPSVIADAVSFDALTQTTYASKLRAGGVQILVSTDGGAIWTEERPDLKSPSYTQDAVWVVTTAADGALYLATQRWDVGFGALYRRTGPPGAGEYELLIYCPVGPHFTVIEAVAVDGRGRILGVGAFTSVYYDGARWAQEYLPDKNSFSGVALGRAGYYAVAANGMSETPTYELLYHP